MKEFKKKLHLNSMLNEVDDELKVQFSYEDIPNSIGIYCFLQNFNCRKIKQSKK